MATGGVLSPTTSNPKDKMQQDLLVDVQHPKKRKSTSAAEDHNKQSPALPKKQRTSADATPKASSSESTPAAPDTPINNRNCHQCAQIVTRHLSCTRAKGKKNEACGTSFW